MMNNQSFDKMITLAFQDLELTQGRKYFSSTELLPRLNFNPQDLQTENAYLRNLEFTLKTRNDLFQEEPFNTGRYCLVKNSMSLQDDKINEFDPRKLRSGMQQEPNMTNGRVGYSNTTSVGIPISMLNQDPMRYRDYERGSYLTNEISKPTGISQGYYYMDHFNPPLSNFSSRVYPRKSQNYFTSTSDVNDRFSGESIPRQTNIIGGDGISRQSIMNGEGISRHTNLMTGDRQSINQFNFYSPSQTSIHYPYRSISTDIKESPRTIKNENLSVYNISDNLHSFQETVKNPKSYLWCHQCKKKNRNVVYCSKYHVGFCSKKYCKRCIEKHYNEDFDSIDQKTWICMFCRGICLCACCRRKRGEEVPKRVMKKRKLEEDTQEDTPDTKKQKIE
jgi:hypothetical protein